MAIAVNPLDIEAKQHFNPDAIPISVPTCFTLRTSSRFAPAFGTDDKVRGPESTMVGLVHEEGSDFWSGAFSFGFGGPPMMPPSMYQTLADSKSAAIPLLVLGAMAFKSRKQSASPPSRCFKPSRILRAVALESLGGTMLRM